MVGTTHLGSWNGHWFNTSKPKLSVWDSGTSALQRDTIFPSICIIASLGTVFFFSNPFGRNLILYQLLYFPTSIDNLTTQRRTCPKIELTFFCQPKNYEKPSQAPKNSTQNSPKNSKMPSKSHPLLSITVRWRCPWWVTTPELSRFGALRSSFLRASAARPTPPWWRSMASDRTWEIWCWISSGCLRVPTDRTPGFSDGTWWDRGSRRGFTWRSGTFE